MEVNNSDFIYMDFNATTPLADEVVAGIQKSLVTDWGNPSSAHQFGAAAKDAISTARKQIADMLHCTPNEITFTSGGTEANNMVIWNTIHYFQKCVNSCAGSKFLDKPHIITTNVEHDSIILPIRYLEKQSYVTCSVIKVDSNGCVKIDDILSEVIDQTALITVMYANNETGVIMPILKLGKAIAQLNQERKKKQLHEVLFHTDAAQIIGKDDVNFESLNAHYLTVVGHKFYGPRIGCIVAKQALHPMLFGGGQEKGIRPGTENTPMIVGLGIAAELVKTNLANYRSHMLQCRNQLERRLVEVFGNQIVINCEQSERLPNTTNISFKMLGLEGFLVLRQCKSLLASVGAACHNNSCSQILLNSGVLSDLAKNAIRLSCGRETTIQDIEKVVMDLQSAVSQLQVNLC